jgi:hypothetical protein
MGIRKKGRGKTIGYQGHNRLLLSYRKGGIEQC